jgi:hypothetical protein
LHKKALKIELMKNVLDEKKIKEKEIALRNILNKKISEENILKGLIQ